MKAHGELDQFLKFLTTKPCTLDILWTSEMVYKRQMESDKKEADRATQEAAHRSLKGRGKKGGSTKALLQAGRDRLAGKGTPQSTQSGGRQSRLDGFVTPSPSGGKGKHPSSTPRSSSASLARSTADASSSRVTGSVSHGSQDPNPTPESPRTQNPPSDSKNERKKKRKAENQLQQLQAQMDAIKQKLEKK